MILGTVLTMIFGLSSSASASETSIPTVVFKSQTQGFVYENYAQDTFGNSFAGMIPGEERTQTILLKNEDTLSVDFYMSSQVLKSLGEEGGSEGQTGATYELTLKRDGEVFFEGTVGGRDGTLKDLNDSEITEDILLSNLKQNETCKLEITLALGGRTTRNEFQGTDAEFQFNFLASYQDPEAPTVVNKVVTHERPAKVNVITQVVTAVRTGDNTALGLFAAALAAGVLLLIVAVRRKKAEEKQ